MIKNPQNVMLVMKDPTGKTHERTIDIGNLLVHRGDTSIIAQNPDKQRELLEDWIDLRGNDQHDTTLSLISWSIV